MLLTAHTSKFVTVTASTVEGMSRDQTCMSPGVVMLDGRSYLGLGLGSRILK